MTLEEQIAYQQGRKDMLDEMITRLHLEDKNGEQQEVEDRGSAADQEGDYS